MNGPFPVGLHLGLPMDVYSNIDAVGSTRLGWMAVSPLHYRYMCDTPHIDTAATRLGTAVHMATLEPALFGERYACEPDLEEMCPGAKSPRATSRYKDWVATQEAKGVTVLSEDDYLKVANMACAILAHPHARKVLDKGKDREVTALWEQEGRRCRGRFDVLGGGLMADIKTTRQIKDFSPWVLTRMGYYRQAGFYVGGAAQLGETVDHFFFIAVENVPPHDVGVFVLGRAELEVGRVESEALLRRVDACERRGEWPGMYPEIVQATLTDRYALDLEGEGDY